MLIASLGLALGACGDSGGGEGGSESMTATDATDPTMTMGGTMTTQGTSATTTMGTSMTMGGTMTTDPDTGTETGLPMGDAAFRFTTLTINDPHFFDTLIGTDITDTVNMLFSDGFNMDDPDMPDGNFDLGLVLVFRDLDPSDGFSGDVDFANADCTVDATTCSLSAGTQLYSTTFTNSDAGPCEPETLPDTTNPAYNAPGTTAGPCFSTVANDVVIVTSFDLPLDMTVLGGQYTGNGIMQGTLRGFLTQAAADASILPDDLPVVGGQPVSALLQDEDKDEGDTGWYFYADFVAVTVPWTD